MKTPNPLQRAFLESGRDVEWFARQLKPRNTGNRKQDAREMDSAKRRFKAALRGDCVSERYAGRVASLLGVERTPLHDLLLKPRASWPSWALPTGERGAKPESIASNGAGQAPLRPSPQARATRSAVASRVSGAEKRRTILEVL